MLSYHLLTRALAPADDSPARLFADAVTGAVNGFVHHDRYVRVAVAAERAPPSELALSQQFALLLACDANPLAALLRDARDAEQFALRWNGINDNAALGVATVIGAAPRAADRRARQGADSALRERVMHSFIEQLRPGGGAARAGQGLAAVAALLGVAGRAPAELSGALYARPDADLAACARALGCTGRTLQRQLGQAWLTFGQVRQAVRVDLAAELLRNTGAPLTEVALAAGFYDAAHFNHAIKLSSSMKPGDYRRLAGGAAAPGAGALPR